MDKRDRIVVELRNLIIIQLNVGAGSLKKNNTAPLTATATTTTTTAATKSDHQAFY